MYQVIKVYLHSVDTLVATATVLAIIMPFMSINNWGERSEPFLVESMAALSVYGWLGMYSTYIILAPRYVQT